MKIRDFVWKKRVSGVKFAVFERFFSVFERFERIFVKINVIFAIFKGKFA
jgi:hypothetical protein